MRGIVVASEKIEQALRVFSSLEVDFPYVPVGGPLAPVLPKFLKSTASLVDHCDEQTRLLRETMVALRAYVPAVDSRRTPRPAAHLEVEDGQVTLRVEGVWRESEVPGLILWLEDWFLGHQAPSTSEQPSSTVKLTEGGGPRCGGAAEGRLPAVAAAAPLQGPLPEAADVDLDHVTWDGRPFVPESPIPQRPSNPPMERPTVVESVPGTDAGDTPPPSGELVPF